MEYVNFIKCQDVLPETLIPNSLYFVKILDSFELFLTTNTDPTQPIPVSFSDLSFEAVSRNLKSYDVDTIKNPAGQVIRKEMFTPAGDIIVTITYDAQNRVSLIKIDLDPSNPDTAVLQKALTYVSSVNGDRIQTRYTPSHSG